MYNKEFEEVINQQHTLMGTGWEDHLADALTIKSLALRKHLSHQPKKHRYTGSFCIDVMNQIPKTLAKDPRVLVSMIMDFQSYRNHMSIKGFLLPDDAVFFAGVDATTLYFYVPSIPCSRAAVQDFPNYNDSSIFHDNGMEIERMNNWCLENADRNALFYYDKINPVGYLSLGLRGYFENDPYHFQVPYY